MSKLSKLILFIPLFSKSTGKNGQRSQSNLRKS